MICLKAEKYLYESSNSPERLVPHEELLFKSAVMLVDGSNRWEEQKLNLKRKI